MFGVIYTDALAASLLGITRIVEVASQYYSYNILTFRYGGKWCTGY